MYVPSNTPNYVCQKCRNKIAPDELETSFLEKLSTTFQAKSLPSHFPASIAEQLSDPVPLKKAVQFQIGEVAVEKELLSRLFSEKRLSKESYEGRLLPLEKRQEQLSRELARLDVAVAEFPRVISENSLTPYKVPNSATWSGYSKGEQRGFVENTVAMLKVTKGKLRPSVEVTFR